MHNAFQKFEIWLRINTGGRMSDSLRARAIYFIAAVMIATQLINLPIMSHTYGRWTMDHSISIFVIGLIGLSIPALRYVKKFYLFAGFYNLLLLGAILASAAFDYTGINSALLPFLLLGTIVCGFISGWRAVLICGLSSILFIWGLYHYSASAPTGALFDPTLFGARNFQRAVQFSIASAAATAITAFASYAMHMAFFDLEKRAEEEQIASKAKTEFLSNMSHELRTPLNGVMGISGLLAKTDMDTQQKEYVEIISSCSQKLLAILEDVMDISRLDEHSYSTAAEPFNLTDTLEPLLDLYRPAARAKGLNIGLRYKEGLPQNFVGDAKAIRKIINNLLSNAIKFTESGSAYICVSGQKTDTGAYEINIGVQDTGIGIAPENIDKAFARFSQLDTRLSRNEEGTGLGLALSRKLAENMGGTLNVLTRQGEGSTFVLRLPLEEGDASPVLTPDIETFQPEAPHTMPVPETDLELEVIPEYQDKTA